MGKGKSYADGNFVTRDELRKFLVDDMKVDKAKEVDVDPVACAIESMKAMREAFLQLSSMMQVMGGISAEGVVAEPDNSFYRKGGGANAGQ